MLKWGVPEQTRPSAQRIFRRSLAGLGAVLLLGTVGYLVLGLSPLDSVYQTVTTVTTVGFEEVTPFGTAEKVFTIVLILVGVGVVLYTLTALLGLAIEGYLGNAWERRRMDHDLDRLDGHAIVCGWGRVGRAAADQLALSGRQVVVVDADEERLVDCPYPAVTGDASRDDVLKHAGIERATTLVASLDTDAASLYVTLTARALKPSLAIIARSRTQDAEQKLLRAGADRVVNPQHIGGSRIAAFALQPHVVDFLEIAMHDADVEFRLEEVAIAPGSGLSGSSVRRARLHEGDGALILALRQHDSGGFVTNPPGDLVMGPGDVVIAVGTEAQLANLRRSARRSAAGP
ncbi:MAG: TrkA family potassium uptake protein [Jiangellales bacterium]